VVHRTSGLERAQHQVDRHDHCRGVEAKSARADSSLSKPPWPPRGPARPSVICGRKARASVGNPSGANSCSIRCWSSSSDGSGATPTQTTRGPLVVGNTPNPPSDSVTDRAPAQARPSAATSSPSRPAPRRPGTERECTCRGVITSGEPDALEGRTQAPERLPHRLGKIEATNSLTRARALAEEAAAPVPATIHVDRPRNPGLQALPHGW